MRVQKCFGFISGTTALLPRRGWASCTHRQCMLLQQLASSTGGPTTLWSTCGWLARHSSELSPKPPSATSAAPKSWLRAHTNTTPSPPDPYRRAVGVLLPLVAVGAAPLVKYCD